MTKILSVVLVVLSAVSARAQVLTTADTIGKGKQAIMLSENHLYDTDVDLNIAYAMYVRGLSEHADLYVSVGETHILGQDQAWVGIGGNIRLLNVKGTSVSLFTVSSVPLHRYQDACTVLVNAAVVVSRPINSKVSVYTGLNTLIPVGARERGLFTPLTNKVNVPVGMALTFGDWTLFTEADLGKLKAVGLALSQTF